jgi:Delta7-sterol 5-desaturase
MMFESEISGDTWLRVWLIGFAAIGILTGIVSGFFKARRIQPGRFKWAIFRHEAIVSTINLLVAAWTLGTLNGFLRDEGLILFKQGAASWWVIALEFGASFILFDTWFYWFHRLMHKGPIYRWVHKTHHKSTAPNLLTTFSENPLETFVNGSFFPAFLVLAATSVGGVHDITMAFIVPFNTFMGLYVHSGHEFLPRWWNKSWASKWFITTTFHDQHHKYFNYNFGGYSPAWDYICGTVRKKYEDDFENPKVKQPHLGTVSSDMVGAS